MYPYSYSVQNADQHSHGDLSYGDSHLSSTDSDDNADADPRSANTDADVCRLHGNGILRALPEYP